MARLLNEEESSFGKLSKEPLIRERYSDSTYHEDSTDDTTLSLWESIKLVLYEFLPMYLCVTLDVGSYSLILLYIGRFSGDSIYLGG